MRHMLVTPMRQGDGRRHEPDDEPSFGGALVGREDSGGQADGAHAGAAQAGHGRKCRAALHRPADELEVFFGMLAEGGHGCRLVRATRHLAKGSAHPGSLSKNSVRQRTAGSAVRRDAPMDVESRAHAHTHSFRSRPHRRAQLVCHLGWMRSAIIHSEYGKPKSCSGRRLGVFADDHARHNRIRSQRARGCQAVPGRRPAR